MNVTPNDAYKKSMRASDELPDQWQTTTACPHYPAFTEQKLGLIAARGARAGMAVGGFELTHKFGEISLGGM